MVLIGGIITIIQVATMELPPVSFPASSRPKPLPPVLQLRCRPQPRVKPIRPIWRPRGGETRPVKCCIYLCDEGLTELFEIEANYVCPPTLMVPIYYDDRPFYMECGLEDVYQGPCSLYEQGVPYPDSRSTGDR